VVNQEAEEEEAPCVAVESGLLFVVHVAVVVGFQLGHHSPVIGCQASKGK
jgi:hypothetical protein